MKTEKERILVACLGAEFENAQLNWGVHEETEG